MRTFAALFALGLSFAAQAQTAGSLLPSAIARADLFNDKFGSVLVIDTPDANDHLILALASSSGQPTMNNHLLGKQITPGFQQIANVYNVSITSNKKGSARVAVWRDMGTSLWSETYTLSTDSKGKMVIAGLDYVYSYREDNGSCSMNFLTGDVIFNGKKLKVAAQSIPFETATEEVVLKGCQTLIDRK